MTLIPRSLGMRPEANSGASLQITPLGGVVAGTRLLPLIAMNVFWAISGPPEAVLTPVMMALAPLRVPARHDRGRHQIALRPGRRHTAGESLVLRPRSGFIAGFLLVAAFLACFFRGDSNACWVVRIAMAVIFGKSFASVMPVVATSVPMAEPTAFAAL